MTTRYQKRHYEDVARILSWHTTAAGVDEDKKRMAALGYLCAHFANLFAADNPRQCYLHGIHGGSCNGAQCIMVGFDPVTFLKACGLESER